MGNFQSLLVWQKSHSLTLEIYRITKSLPAAERFGLIDQMRRAASSIPANIAEGCGRNSDAELARYCRIGLGSANELEYHLLLARDLTYLPPAAYKSADQHVKEVRRMLSALVERLKNKKS